MSDEVEAALRQGKFPVSRRQHYEALMAADPVGTRQLLASLWAAVPMEELGGAPAPRPQAAAAPPRDSYPKDWLGPQDGKPKTELGGLVVFGND